MTARREMTPAKPAGFRPAIAILPRLVKETGRKGAVKPGRVTTAGLNKQSGLKCTGCGPSDRRPGYHRVYGETTKPATEASVFSDRLSMG